MGMTSDTDIIFRQTGLKVGKVLEMVVETFLKFVHKVEEM